MRPVPAFLARFITFALLGFAVEIVPWVDLNLVQPLTRGITALSGGLVSLFGGAVAVSSNVMVHPDGFAIRISNGCSGLEAVILLAAAMLAYPAQWRSKLWGLLAGFVLIMGLNLLRVISLYYIGQYSRAWFDWAHLYAWDVLIIIDGLIVFLLWLRYLPDGPRRNARAPA
jgi:exosortase H (IPTLxxWG-CTERM-specific)